MTYARVQNGTIMELFSPPAGFLLAQSFPPALAAQFIAVPSGAAVKPGWRYQGGAFSPPPASPPPTVAQQAMAALAAGCHVVSPAHPGLAGVYAIDPWSEQKIMAVSLYIAVNHKFPGGAAQFAYPDASGTVHVFPDPLTFQAFAAAITDYVSALDGVIMGSSASLPAQPVLIG